MDFLLSWNNVKTYWLKMATYRQRWPWLRPWHLWATVWYKVSPILVLWLRIRTFGLSWLLGPHPSTRWRLESRQRYRWQGAIDAKSWVSKKCWAGSRGSHGFGLLVSWKEFTEKLFLINKWITVWCSNYIC